MGTYKALYFDLTTRPRRAVWVDTTLAAKSERYSGVALELDRARHGLDTARLALRGHRRKLDRLTREVTLPRGQRGAPADRAQRDQWQRALDRLPDLIQEAEARLHQSERQVAMLERVLAGLQSDDLLTAPEARTLARGAATPPRASEVQDGPAEPEDDPIALPYQDAGSLPDGDEIPVPGREDQAATDARLLDELNLPLDFGRPAARHFLRQVAPDLKIGDQRLSAALAYRKRQTAGVQ